MQKNNGFKCVLSIMIFCAFLVIDCSTEADDPPPQKKVTINDIPSIHNYRYGTSSFSRPYNGNILAMSDTVVINNGTVTMGLYDYNADPYSKVFTEDGNYIVLFIITGYSGTTLYSAGGIGPMNITQETITIPFNGLIQVPLSSISSSMLRMGDVLPEIVKKLNIK
jgi:hypothetical protein